MVKLEMPETRCGDWIGLKALQYRDDSFLLARHEFAIDRPGHTARLWISGDSAYALYLNEQFVGCGPRMQSDPDAAGVDVYDVEFFLHPGINVISVILYAGSRVGEGARRSDAGFWCQLNSENEQLESSGREWRVCACPALTAPRARQAGGSLLRMEYVDFSGLPIGWMSATFDAATEGWEEPDFVMSPDEARIELRLDPLHPAAVELPMPFTLCESGTIVDVPVETHAAFSSIYRKGSVGTASYAAAAFVYVDEARLLKLKFISDDPFRLFCNDVLIAAGRMDDGALLRELPLRTGWNRLLVVQEPHENSAGFMMVMPEESRENFRIYQDTLAEASGCWNLVGPLQLPLMDATSSICFERLTITPFEPTRDNLGFISDYLSCCRAEAADGEVKDGVILGPHEYALYRLDSLRYGLPRVSFTGSSGLQVDIGVGYWRNERGIPVRSGGRRGVDTVRCSGNDDVFNKFYPLECCYLMVCVRSGSGRLRLGECTFDELVRAEREQSHFESSDAELNLLWEIGERTVRRAAARVRYADLHEVSDCYLLDAFIHAENMAVVCGDYDYSAVRLRQYGKAQFENGDIPAFCFQRDRIFQLQHLFFLPNWILFNYRMDSDLDTLSELSSSLDLLMGYLNSLVDSRGLLSGIGGKINMRPMCDLNRYDHEDTPTTLNALFCRFLLSSAEVYRRLGDEDTMQQYMRQASLVAAALRKSNFDEDRGLYRMNSRGSVSDSHEMHANFLALQSGVLSMEELENFFYRYFNFDPPFHRCPDVSENNYFLFLFLEMMFAVGQGEWALRCLKKHWMARADAELLAWRESPDSEEIAASGLSGGSAVSPNIFLVREVAGVRIAEGEEAAIFLSPVLSAVDWVSLMLPTRWGRIKVEWRHDENGGLEVTIEAGFPLKVVPQLSRETLMNTSFKLSDRVTLLDPGEE